MTSSHSSPCNDHNNLYPEIRLLVKGTNSKVHLCRNILPGSVVAVKTVYRTGGGIPRESRALQMVKAHENIVPYFGVVDHIDPGSQRIVFEYCQNGNLDDYRESMKNNFPETFLWNVFRQLAQGLSAIHRAEIVHGDLTTSNVLVGPMRSGEHWSLLKICDFSAAVLRPDRDIPLSHCATWSAQPPEAERAYGTETDIWSLGVIIHLLAHGKLPYRSVPTAEPDPDPEKWFIDARKQVPVGTSDELLYKKFCLWRVQNNLSIISLHSNGTLPAKYSRLLNHFMIRALDIRYLRITASQLCNFLPTLERFVQDITKDGLAHIVNCWKHDTVFTDSRVVRHVYFALVDYAYTHPGMVIIYPGRWLPSLMGVEDRFAAYRHLDACGKRDAIIISDDSDDGKK